MKQMTSTQVKTPNFLLVIWVLGIFFANFPMLSMFTAPLMIGILGRYVLPFIRTLNENKEKNIHPVTIILFSLGLFGSLHPFYFWGDFFESMFGSQISHRIEGNQWEWNFLPLLGSIFTFQLINFAFCYLPFAKKLSFKHFWCIFVISQIPSNLFFGVYLATEGNVFGFTYGLSVFITPIVTVITWLMLFQLSKKS